VERKDSVPALDGIVRTYQRGLRIHLQSKFPQFCPDQDKANEWLQDFFLQKVMIGSLMASAAKERGRFRTLLVNALDNFAISQIRREHSKKRNPGSAIEPLLPDGPDAPPAPEPIPGTVIDLEWARDLIAETLRRMEAKCQAENRPERWGLFQARLLDPLLDGASAPHYEELIARFGFRSPSEASNTLLTAKRMFVGVLKEVVNESIGGKGDVEREIRELQWIVRGVG
jgi:RNA polymerase sigma-70 factor (ECF subfamily)